MNERHRERFRGGSQLDGGRVDRAERHAPLAAAKALGFRPPPCDALEFRD